MHPDHLPYAKYMTRANVEKTLNSLSGILEGIAIDGLISRSECDFLRDWIREHEDLLDLHPFNEFVGVIRAALERSELTPEDRADLRWLFERLRSTGYYDQITADLQRLHAILGGIVADGVVTADELKELTRWLGDHPHLATCWPYDEVDSLVAAVMSDGRIDEEEHKILCSFFSEFIAVGSDRTISGPLVADEFSCPIGGLCATCPSIEFEGSTFCFTGASLRCSRREFQEKVMQLGGRFSESVTRKVKYLVIGADGNPCWAYACYGRKVEQAVELRRSGVRIVLVHENDFHDAVADQDTRK